MRHINDKIHNLICGFGNYGYVVSARPIPGDEEDFYQHLRVGLARLEANFESNTKELRTRGKSKRAIAALHRRMPEPIWGVEVR